MKRLESLHRKLENNPVQRKQYDDGMQALLTTGFAVKVPAEDLTRQDGVVWYFPHHPVINPKKDKPRVVFDSAACHGGVSLNSQVCSGPDLTNSLVDVLLQFRQQPVAFMWWPEGDVTRAPETYKMTVHLFGGTWSPLPFDELPRIADPTSTRTKPRPWSNLFTWMTASSLWPGPRKLSCKSKS